jgi:hypothetical protein
MESSLWIKLLASGLAGFALLYVLRLRPWRPRRFWNALSPSVDLLFLSGVLLGVLALFEPMPFDGGARLLLDQTDLPASLDSLDREIAELADAPRRLWIELLDQIGLAQAAPAPPAPYDPVRDGHLQRRVLPAVQAIVSVLLRAFFYAGSLMVIAVALVMRIFSRWRAAHPPRDPAPRPASLEERVLALEESLATLHTRSLPGAQAP